MAAEVTERGAMRDLDENAPPRATLKKASRFSPIWLIPIVAGAVVLYLLYTSFISRGPVITITFRTGEGLTAGETVVRHKAVALGKVEDIELSKDMSEVVVKVRIDRHAKTILTDHARFWVVRPRLSSSSLSGLETLVSGAFIEADPGAPGGHPQKHFKGLEEPPGVRSDEPGTTYILESTRLRGLAQGAPVYFRDLNVGEVLTADVSGLNGPLKIKIFVRQPFDGLVRPETRFWNASGLFVNMGPEGMQLEIESLQSLLAGGISFETPHDNLSAPSAEGATFHLYDNKGQADTEIFQERVQCVTYLRASVGGLGRGSEVVVYGVQVGIVTDVTLVPDDKSPGRMRARVGFVIQPERLGTRPGAKVDETVAPLVHAGMRAVLDSGSLLTGQQLLSLEYAPSARAAELEREDGVWVVPGDAGGMESLKTVAGDIAAKLNRIPFDEIGNNLNATLVAARNVVGGPELRNALVSLNATLNDVQHLVKQADAGLSPALAKLPAISEQLQSAVEKANAAFGSYGADSDFHKGLDRLIRQVGEAARTIRLLADYLDRHPESLIRGRSEGGK